MTRRLGILKFKHITYTFSLDRKGAFAPQLQSRGVLRFFLFFLIKKIIFRENLRIKSNGVQMGKK